MKIVQKSLFDELKSVPDLPNPDTAFFVPTGTGASVNRLLSIIEKFQRSMTKNITLMVFGGSSLSIQVDNSSYSVSAVFKEIELIALDTGGKTSSVSGAGSAS